MVVEPAERTERGGSDRVGAESSRVTRSRSRPTDARSLSSPRRSSIATRSASGASAIGGDRPSSLDGRPAPDPGGQPGQGHVGGIAIGQFDRRSCQARRDRDGPPPAHRLVERDQERPPRLGRRGRCKQSGTGRIAGRASSSGEPAHQPAQDRRPDHRRSPRCRRREPSEACLPDRRGRAVPRPTTRGAEYAGHRHPGRAPAGAGRLPARAPGSRRAVQASCARTVTSGSRAAISASRAASREETFGSSPTRRTHQARTSASGCSSSRFGRSPHRARRSHTRPTVLRAPRPRGRPSPSGAGRRPRPRRRRSASRRRALRRYQTLGWSSRATSSSSSWPSDRNRAAATASLPAR